MILKQCTQNTLGPVYSIKNLTTCLPVFKYLIGYNSNNTEENEEEKETISIELTEQNVEIENEENVIDFRLLNVQEEDEEEITKANFIETLQRQTDEENIPKK